MKQLNELKTKRRIKMVLAIIGSFFIVSYGSPHVFVANSFEVKDSFIAWLKLTPQRIYAYMRHPRDNDARTNVIENATLNTVNREDKSELQYTPISKGVYAAEDPETKEEFIKIEAGTEVKIYTFTIDGREVKVYAPAK